MNYKCDYCESEYEGERCPYCGAPHPPTPNATYSNADTNTAYNDSNTPDEDTSDTSFNTLGDDNFNPDSMHVFTRKKELTEYPGFVISMLIIFFPVGIYYMWKNGVFKLHERLIITVCFVIFVSAVLSKANHVTDETSVAGNNETVTKIAQEVEVAVTDTPTQSPADKPVSTRQQFIKDTTKLFGVSKKTMGALYDLLHEEMGFEKIELTLINSKEKNNYNFNVDNFILTAAFDEDGIHSVNWGFYVLYDGKEIKIDKQGLLDRQLLDTTKYYIIAREVIEDNIKTPKTAEFPPLDSSDVNMQRNGDLVGIEGYFDAQNTYGAIVRSKYIIEVTITDLDTYDYNVVYVNIDGEIKGEWVEFH